MIINNKIRINSDLGEGTGVEKDIMPFLSSCSIACGGHTGDKSSMTDTILIAKKYGVNIGAHPSYPDKENFGRKNISISHADLSNSLMSQIDELDRIAGSSETSLNHIKLHGALYNFSANDLETASNYFMAKYEDEDWDSYEYIYESDYLREEKLINPNDNDEEEFSDGIVMNKWKLLKLNYMMMKQISY